jgi:hypothetical protein
MGTQIAEPTMAKRNDVTVKVDAEVVATAKMVAASREVSLAEYLSEVLRPLVKRDLDQEYARRNQPPKTPKDKGSK